VTPGMAAEVSQLGGLGMLAIGRSKAAAARRQIGEGRALTSRPVGAGFLVVFLARAVLAEGAAPGPIGECFWGWADASLVPANCTCGWQVGSVDEAKAAVDAGCAYVIAQGVEAGGHVRGTTARTELVSAVRAAVEVPVVASGGIGTADDIRRAVAAG